MKIKGVPGLTDIKFGMLRSATRCNRISQNDIILITLIQQKIKLYGRKTKINKDRRRLV